ncbi:MAG: hypothetical protein KIT56_02950, partial [Gammaproteobacteria bacterium]|nr:hypothetical protein [Gammaproteobacteria bacterium]
MNSRDNSYLSDFFKYIPDIFINKDTCMEAAYHKLENIRYIPTALQNTELYLKCIKKYTDAHKLFDGISGEKEHFISNLLDAIPDKIQTEKLFLGLIELKLVELSVIITAAHNHNINTDDLLRSAFDESLIKIYELPNHLHSYEIYKKGIEEGDSDFTHYLSQYVKKNKNKMDAKIRQEIQALFTLAVKNGERLQDIPEEFRNEEISVICILNKLKKAQFYHEWLYEIQFIPDSVKNSESFWLSLISHPGGFYCFKYMPDDLKVRHSIREALKNNCISSAIKNIRVLDDANL